MYHASLSYPDAIIPFLELGFTLLAALLVLARPWRLDGALRRCWRRLAAIPPWRAVLASALLAGLLSAATMAWLGFPVAQVSDELGHLLLADTFAEGRLTNPTPRVPEAFEAVHLIVRPSYTAKYPPATGLLLAPGVRLGRPGIALCLSAALLAAACCWFLQGWLPPPWPLAGTVLAALRLGVGSYWGQSYWGGTAAAIGGLLLYGALARLFRPAGGERLAWAPLALGLFLLANSRPLEGAVGALPAAVVVAAALLRRWREWRGPIAALAVALAAAAAATAGYNAAVTGDPLLLPYRLHMATYGVDAMSPWAAPPPPVSYSSPVLAAHLARDFPRPASWQEAVAGGAGRFARMTYFVLGLPMLVFAVLALRWPGRGPRRRWKLFALLCASLPAAVHSVTAWWFPHYSAATSGPLLLLALLGMREGAVVRWRGRRLGPWLAAAALLVRIPLTLVELPAFRPDRGAESRFVERLWRELGGAPGPTVLVVADELRGVQERVYNRAELDRAPLLWIQDLGPEVTARVVAAYSAKRVFRLVPGGEGEPPRLVPWQPGG